MYPESKYYYCNIRRAESDLFFPIGTIIGDKFNRNKQYKGTFPIEREVKN